jgi:hypothetical protein
MIDSISSTLLNRIVEGLVRVNDIVEDKNVYGGITENERHFIKQSVNDLLESGIDYHDSVDSLVEYFKDQKYVRSINEVGVVGTVGQSAGQAQTTPPASAGQAAPTTSAGQTTPPTAANTAPKTTTVGSTPGQTPKPAQPINPQGLAAMAQMLANAGLSSSQLGTLTNTVKQNMSGQGG